MFPSDGLRHTNSCCRLLLCGPPIPGVSADAFFWLPIRLSSSQIIGLSMPACKLTKRTIDALPAPAERDAIWWDEDLKVFGLKVTGAGRKFFLVQSRPGGDRRNPRKYTIGEYGQVTPYQARVEAQRVLAERA